MQSITKEKQAELRAILAFHNVTDKDIANATGYTRVYVNNVRNGKVPVRGRNRRVIEYIESLGFPIQKAA